MPKDTIFKSAKTELDGKAEESMDVRKTPGLTTEHLDVPNAKDGEEDNISVWESENKRQYIQDIFNIRETAHEFPLSAQWKFIDKFIKGELETRNYEKTRKNYMDILKEFEDDIGSEKTETYTRIRRIFEYIKVLKKFREAKEKRNAFRELYKSYKEE